MWRWIIRVWASIVVFWISMFFSSAVVVMVARLMATVGLPFLVQLLHSHTLLSMFMLGVLAGQAVVGSNFTGRGWFRSKSGLTYEGFKLESLKSWTWILVSPVFVLGVVSWMLERSESGVLSNVTLTNFYHDVLMPNCSLSWWKNYRLYPFCGVQLICVGIWMASIGYSLAPLVRRHGFRLLRSILSANEGGVPVEKRQQNLMKEKTE
jgi:hypothetical protein